MSEIVKYHNDMNKINLSSYSEKELNLFFSLIFLSKEKGETRLVIKFSELKELADGDKNKERFIKNLINVNKKLIKLNHQIEVNNVIHIFTLFNTFSIDKDNNTLTVEINKVFSYMLNNLIGNFTKFDLIDFVKLKSTYSKNIFKILKQWENIRVKEFTIEEFRKILAIPESYRMSIIDIKVLKPITTELQTCFCDLKIEKLKTGRKVTGIKFSWKKKKENNDINENIQGIIEISISNDLNKAIEKAKQNRYIEKLLDIDNIEILTEMFKEKELIKGLNYAYKEINQEIKSLNYLIKTIKTGIKYKEKKIVVKSENKEAEEIKETREGNKSDEIKSITKDEYEELYQKYLKENEIDNIKLARQCFERSVQDKYIVKEKKIYTEKDIDESLLVSKNGKKLVGNARAMRIEKILKNMNGL